MMKAVLVFLFLTIIASCSRSLDKNEYVEWVKDPVNGLHVKERSGEFEFDLQYLPSDYVWITSGMDANTRKSSSEQFILTILPIDPSRDLIIDFVQNESEKQERLYYFAYQFQNDLSLVSSNQRKTCVLFHFERQHDVKNGRTFLLGFEPTDTSAEEMNLMIESPYFSSLPISVKISKKNIPSLTI